MSKWRVPVSWEMCGFVDVESETLAEAMVIARDDDGILPLPKDGTYIDGRWRLSTDDEGIVRAFQQQERQKTNIYFGGTR